MLSLTPRAFVAVWTFDRSRDVILASDWLMGRTVAGQASLLSLAPQTFVAVWTFVAVFTFDWSRDVFLASDWLTKMADELRVSFPHSYSLTKQGWSLCDPC